jgi:glycosyltransferase involved in cell wall biosynthesis
VDASACLRNRRWLQRFRPLFDFGDAFVVLSEHVVERLVSAGAPAEKIHVWSIGIDFGQYQYRERKAPGVPVRILCAARFVEKKGHPMLLEAFRLLRKRHDAALTLVGYGPLRDEIRRTASSLGVGSCVTIIDTSKGVDFEVLYPKLLESHDLFALSSTVAADGDDEGGPALTVVCAQATGMPVVVTPFIGAERSVVDRETGLVCDAGAQALSDLLAEVIEDHDLAVSVGRAGATRVRAEFSLEKQRDALEDIYQLAMQGNSQPERREVDRAAQ